MAIAAAVAFQVQVPRDAQVVAAPPIVVRGRVVNDAGEAVRNARIGLTPGGIGTPVVLSDLNGRFTIAAPQGAVLNASKTGYTRREGIRAAADGVVDIRLQRSSAVSGRVLDELGDPVIGTRVIAEDVSQAPRVTTIASADTDDRGEYRLTGLSGTVAVAVNRPGGIVVESTVRIGGQAPNKTYFPGVPNVAGAEQFHLEAGEDRRGIDFTVPVDQTEEQLTVLIGNSVFGSDSDIAAAAQFLAAARNAAAQGGTISINLGVPGAGRGAAPSAPPPTGTAIIRGRVVSTDGAAVPHAQVRVTALRPGVRKPPVKTDDDGRFEIGELPAGKYNLTAGKSGFSPVPGQPSPGAPFPFGRLVEVADAQSVERIEVPLARWKSLSGRVLDEYGDPIEGVSVQLLQLRYGGGRRYLSQVGSSRLTDDLGRYRISNFAPGRYIVSASVGAVFTTDLPGYARSYYPGTPDASEAQFVNVTTLLDTIGIDFSLARIQTARVSGIYLNSSGEPQGGGINLISSRTASVTNMSVGARILPDGRFEFPNVPPGQYVIQAYRGSKNGWTEGEFAAVPVSVGGADVTGIVVQTSVGSTIAGRFVFDGDTSKLPPSARVGVTPVPVDPDLSPSPVNAQVHPDWTFEITGINGPRRFDVRTPTGWALKEIRVDGSDATDRPLPFGTPSQSLADVEIVLTDRVNDVSVTVTDDRATPVPTAHVIAFSTERERWYAGSRFMRRVVSGPNGAASLSGLPPGNYYAAATLQAPTDGPDAWTDPSFLDSLIPRATNLVVAEGDHQSITLKLPPR